MYEVDRELTAAARAAFPGKSLDWWLVYDPLVTDDIVPLETAPDDVILSQADVLEEWDREFDHAHWLRAFVRWRRRRHLTVVG